MLLTLILAVGLAVFLHWQIGALRQRLDRAENLIAALSARLAAQPLPPAAAGGPDATGATEATEATPRPPPPLPEAARQPPLPTRPPLPPLPSAGAVPPVAATTPDARAPQPRPRPSLEETLATKWAVYAGGLALALGAVFLVNYTIEQGLIGPGVRVVLGLLLAVALVGAGEWFRRTDRRLGFHDATEAHIPSILTAAGTVAAFATLYAAHALYGFLGSGLAFALLGAVGIATMLAAALHGPALAGLGLAGSYATPALVTSAAPNPWPVVLYLGVVAAAALMLARLRGWAWLAATTVAGSLAWGLFLLDHATAPLRTPPPPPPPVIDPVTGLATYTMPVAPLPLAGWLEATYVHAVLQLALAAGLVALAPYLSGARRPDAERAAPLDLVATACLAGHALLALAALTATPAGGAAWSIYAAATVLILAATAWLAPPVASAAPLAGLLAALTALFWPSARDAQLIEPFSSLGSLLGYPTETPSYLVFAALAAATPAIAATLRLWRGAPVATTPTALYALGATAMPLLVLVVAYVRAGELAASTAFMSAAFLLAGGYAALAEAFRGRERRIVHIGADAAAAPAVAEAEAERARWRIEAADASALASGAFAAAAAGALVIGLTIVTDRQYLAAALALAALATAWVANARAIPLLRHVVGAIGVLVLARLLVDPALFGLDVGRLPILNALAVVYGIPAAAFAAAAFLLRRSHAETGTPPDVAVHLSEGLALLLAALLAFFEIRHLTNGGDALASTSGHVEQGLLAMTALGFSQIAARLDRHLASRVFRIAASLFAVLALAFAVLGLGIAHNPAISGDRIAGPALVNSLLLAYLAPGLMALYLARISRGVRHPRFIQAAGVVGLVLVFLYATLAVRHMFQGPHIGLWKPAGSAEIWGYTIAWLGLGIALLGYGLWRRLMAPRIASAVLIVGAAVKVVLVDLAGVTGIWRALSFLCLGAVLIGIGLVYQRLIFVKRD